MRAAASVDTVIAAPLAVAAGATFAAASVLQQRLVVVGIVALDWSPLVREAQRVAMGRPR